MLEKISLAGRSSPFVISMIFDAAPEDKCSRTVSTYYNFYEDSKIITTAVPTTTTTLILPSPFASDLNIYKPPTAYRQSQKKEFKKEIRESQI
jgi:hypothetical protein